MKPIIFLEILNKLKANPKLKKKIKIFIVIGIIGFLFTGAVTIWAGYTAIQYTSVSAQQVFQSPVTQKHLENIKTELSELSNFQTMNCWTKMQTLFSAQPWLDKPALENLMSLKNACFDPSSINTKEGITI